MLALPEAIAAAAYRATNGELAWRRVDLPAALAVIADHEQAVLGGEVWLVLGAGRWTGLVRNARGGPPDVWHWDTLPQLVDESWQVYCQRAAKESAQLVAEMRVEEVAEPAVHDRLFFNLTYITEAVA